MFRLSRINQYYVTMSLPLVYFLITLFIPYLLYRGLPIAQVFTLLSAYNVLSVVFEYPTGVLGDVFGYKRSVMFGEIMGVIAMVMMAQPGSAIWYMICLAVLALAISSISGSDMGILNLVAPDIKKASSNFKFASDMTLFVAAIVGGFLAKIDYSLALYINAFIWLLAAVAMYRFPFDQVRVNKLSNIYNTATQGISYTLRSRKLLGIMLINMVIIGFAFNVKSIFGLMNNIFAVSVDQIGWFIGLGILFRAFGAKTYPKLELNIGIVGLMIAVLVGISGWDSVGVAVMCLFIAQAITGYFMAAVDAQTHELAVNEYRASIFSLKKLLSKIFSAGYLALIGIILGVSTFKVLMITTGSILLFGSLGFVILSKLNHQSTAIPEKIPAIPPTN